MTTDRTELLTKTIVERTPYAAAGQYVIADTQIPGFCLRVGKVTKTFTLRRGFRGKSCQRALGLAACLGKRSKPLVTVGDARKAAYALIAEFSKGVDPKEARLQAEAAAAQEERERGLTLRQAIKLHAKGNGKGNRPRAERTVANYEHFETKGYLAAWMDRPLASIKRMEVYERHQELTKQIAAGKYAGEKAGRKVPSTYDGRTTANQVFRWFRAVYNRAMVLDETLPPNPCIAVAWHALPQKRSAIPSTKLAAWREGVMAIPNPVRRDFLLFALFSGLRRTSAAEVRWEHVDFERRLLHIPKPKGGVERAFDLPLSDYLVELLEGRRDGNPGLVELQLIPDDATEWVFPAYGASGHIAEPRETIEGVPFTIHDLRRTFVTTAEALDIPLHVIGALVNHRQPGGSVTAGYASHEVERLREPMQRITDRLRALLKLPAPDNVVPLQRRA